jgi:hypothetical protein
MGIGSFLVLALVVDPGNEELDTNAVGLLMIFVLLVPLTALVYVVARYLYSSKVSKVKTLSQRELFAQRLHDIVNIVSLRSALELRAYAFQILDNDYHTLDAALDVLQYTVLGLQPMNPRKWRCSPHTTFELAIPGRVEGELRALGLEPEGDARIQLRRLREYVVLHEGVSRQLSGVTSESTGTSSRSSRNTITNGMHSAQEYFQGIPVLLKKMFETLDKDHSHTVSEEEFVAALRDCLDSEHGDLHGFNDAALRSCYRYIDVDGSGEVSLPEFCTILQGVGQAAVMPPWWEAANANQSKGDDVLNITANTEETGVDETGSKTSQTSSVRKGMSFV